MQDALDKRNHLAHHFFKERTQEIFSESGRAEMITELEEMQAHFLKATHIVTRLYIGAAHVLKLQLEGPPTVLS